jgi:hypothetical protein
LNKRNRVEFMGFPAVALSFAKAANTGARTLGDDITAVAEANLSHPRTILSVDREAVTAPAGQCPAPAISAALSQ